MPQVRDLADLNRHLLDSCREDGQRLIGGRTESTGTLMVRERDFLRPLPQQGMDLTEVSFPTVASAGCVTLRTNRYSTPLRPGMKASRALLSTPAADSRLGAIKSEAGRSGRLDRFDTVAPATASERSSRPSLAGIECSPRTAERDTVHGRSDQAWSATQLRPVAGSHRKSA